MVQVTDELLDSLVATFGTAWHDEDDKTNGDNYVTGNRRRAGILAVLEELEQRYVMVERDGYRKHSHYVEESDET